MNRLKSLTNSFIQEQDGAVVTEYGMLIVVIVLGLAIAMGVFRKAVASWFVNIGNNLSNLNSNT